MIFFPLCCPFVAIVVHTITQSAFGGNLNNNIRRTRIANYC